MTKVKAKITFSKTLKNTLLGSVAFRPNHNFGNENDRYFYIGQVYLDKDDIIKAGDVRIADVLFLEPQYHLKKLLKPGLKWRMQAAARLIAEAEVLKVYKEN